MYKLLVTDLDDTLYSWINFFIPAFYEMVSEISKITNIDETVLIRQYQQQHRKFGSVEHPFVTLTLPSIIEHFNGCNEVEVKERLNPAFHRFNSIRKHKLKLYPSVLETLRKIYDKGILIIGYTESAEENGFYRLKKLEIDSYFNKVYVSDSQYRRDSSIPHSPKTKLVHGQKPNPEILQQICNDAGITSQDVVYVGDSLTKDIYMAKQANICAAQVKYSDQSFELYQKLVDISHWTEVDFEREKELKELCITSKIKADFEISSFSQLLDIMHIK